ncbi:MAG: hypothetical protein M1835_004559 [Candelina submexicana]|nr:MAG: hypothetical protein M1835_004559 [Candelina submexicana]
MAPSRAILLTIWAWMSLTLATASYIPIPESSRDPASQMEGRSAVNLPRNDERHDLTTGIITSTLHPLQEPPQSIQHQSAHTSDSADLLPVASISHPYSDETNQILRKRINPNGGDVPVKMGCFPMTGTILRGVLYGIPKIVKAVKVCLTNHAVDPGFAAGGGVPGATNANMALGMMG